MWTNIYRVAVLVLLVCILLSAVFAARGAWGAYKLQRDEACATTLMLYGGETSEQFDRIAELRQKWCLGRG